MHSTHGLPPLEQGNPLLPGPLARSISFGTGSIRGAVRTARSVGRVPFQVARYTTAASIEVSRQAFDLVLGQTGRNLYAQYATRGGAGSEASEADRLRVASVIESTFDAAHRGFHYLQLFTAAGFELTGNSVATLMDMSEVLLLLVDSTLGSTESSRALRSIINFMSLEFQNPATGLPGERVGFRDLMWGLCGLMYLQNVCRRLDEEERTRLAIETVIWDVVVLDGRRVDVHENSLYGSHRGAYRGKQWTQQAGALTAATVSGGGDNMDLDIDHGELPESLIRRQVLAAMSSDARITVSTSTAKMITVDITGNQPPPPISPPPGVELVELGPLHSPTPGNRPALASSQEATYRIVFRINTNDAPTSLTTIPPSEAIDVVVQLDDDDVADARIEDVTSDKAISPTLAGKQQDTVQMLNKPLPNPLSSQNSTTSTSTSRSTSASSATVTAQTQPSVANQKKVRQPAATNSSSRTSHASSAKPPIPSRVSSGSSSTTALTKQAPSNSEKKGSLGIRAALKRGNLLHKDSPSQASKAAEASSAPSARKGAGRTISPVPPPPPKKAKSGTTTSASPPASSPPPSMRPPVPPSRSSSSVQKTQMVRTPLTSRALFRHEAPTPGSRDKDASSAYSNYHRSRPSITADDLESLASLASLASTFADNISIHTTARGDNAQPHHDDRDLRQTLAVPTGGPVSRPSTENGTPRGHRARANRNSIYTLHTNDSQASLILSAYGPGGRRGGLYDNLGGVFPGHSQGHPPAATNPLNPGAMDTLDEVRRTGRVPGLFPAKPLLHNLQRYMRFSSAAYGRDFLRAMGISSSSFGNTSSSKKDSAIQQAPHHHEIASYARHTGVAPEDIVMASFIDAKGGPDSSGETRMPLVHYIALDHASKAVVLACRGTLGFEDILADMACEYDSLYWRGRTYQVHKGIHASARRLLYGGDGRVLATLRDTLLQYPDYGLVLCGHSLGGAVTALLGVMLSEPRPATAATTPASASGSPGGQLLGQFFQTKSVPPRLLVSESTNGAPGTNTGAAGSGAGREVPSLPPGRPVHVFAYGAPGTMSPGLCKVTRGLVTSIVQGYDLVPFLSLGVLHDFQAVSLAFKTDDSQASAELWGRLWDKFRGLLAQRWSSAGNSDGDPSSHKSAGPDPNGIDDAWAYSALKTLRASMLSQKLLPPGEVLVVETQRVLQRTTYGGGGASQGTPSSPFLMVSPARRVVLKYVRDVEARFREIRFGLAAFADHSPGRYERALDQLVIGVQF